MSFTLAIWKRDFSALLAALPLEYKMGPYSWSVMGGPKKAEVYAYGKALDLWELLNYCRCPMQIITGKGDATWFGYLAEIKLEIGKWATGMTIDSMANYVGVAYEDDADQGQTKITAWKEDYVSTAEYGRKEVLFTSNGSNSIHALAARDATLEMKKYPQPVITSRQSGGKDNGALFLRGWMDTLAWRYYANAGTDQVDTATQIYDIATACGEFLEGVDLEVASGISTAETRDGKANGLYEITELLKMGTSNYRRMLCEVTAGRRLMVYEEPVIGNTINHILASGALCDPYDTELRKEICPVGNWARHKDVVPANVDITKIADPNLMFIDEAEYDPMTDQLNPIPRGFIDPFSIGVPKDG